MRGHHDLGGRPAGPVTASEHNYALWEKRVDALMVLLASPDRRIIYIDELRRNMEALPPEEYDRLRYYERLCSGIGNSLIQRGVITIAELSRKMAEVRDRAEQP